GLGVIESARIRHGQNPTLNRTHIRFRTKTSPLPHHPRTPFSQDRIGDTTCINDKKIDQVVHHGPAVLNLPSRKLSCRTTNTPVPWTAHGGHLNLGGSPCPFDARPWPRRSPQPPASASWPAPAATTWTPSSSAPPTPSRSSGRISSRGCITPACRPRSSPSTTTPSRAVR